ncbi:MAG: N-formylglutamate amidohydrolase, partial [Candidatus Hinthialibacter sp.]
MNSTQPTPPFILQTGQSRNVIFETPHLGRAVPEELHRHSKLVEAARRRWDNHIDRAGEKMLADVGGEWLGSVYSRMVVDLNRGPDRVDSRVSPDWPGSRIYEDGGVIVPFVKNK